MLKMNSIPEALLKVSSEIKFHCKNTGRSPDSVRLLAVSKTKPIALIQEAFNVGQREFGESYVQEAVKKIEAYRPPGIVWHFIGPIQSNKTRLLARYFDWVHSLDRFKIAERLSDQRAPEQGSLNVCIQVNIDEEPSKSGVTLSELPGLAHSINALPNLQLRGLMTVPAKHQTLAEQRQPFAKLFEAYEQLRKEGIPMDTLSMGMSHDLEAAILEGATLVRVGTAIFGPRGN
jgi:PLP dependent protein